ncbi:MAG: thioredoxin family protein, partial [Planctomycetia bacterium]|nr:thioredoxin family protein [Planctomycetia bacterium]
MFVTQAGGTVRGGAGDAVLGFPGGLAVLAALVLCAAPAISTAADAAPAWLTSYDAALAAAESSGRPVLALFTGSDWCPHCKTLEHKVFASEPFQAWARENVVLLMIDLPQAGITQDVRNERSQVCINYGVRTFPTVLLLGPDGRKITAQTGYTGQSPADWLARMREHMPAPTVARDAAPTGDTAKLHGSLDEAVATVGAG